jgi:RecB family exonuclease
MLLLTGPPASGKTSFCVERVREHLRSGERNWRLLVPTATLAEHLRNQLVRDGFVFAPTSILTLAKFVDNLVPGLPLISDAGLEIVTEEVLTRACPARYQQVADFAGFRRAFASATEEFTSAGGTHAEGDFGAALAEVVKLIHARGRYLQPERLTIAQKFLPVQHGAYYLAGFYSFNNPELDLIRSLAQTANVTVCLPEWPGSDAALKTLRSFASEERTLSAPSSAARRTLVAAPTLDSELTEIARRLLAEHAAGRPWRDVGILVRSEEPYVPALRSALERFGIPARFYFGAPLALHPAIRYFSALIDAMLAGWDHAATLEALRLPGSPLEHDDRYDYEVRARLPGAGLELLRDLAGDVHASYFATLDKLTSWQTSSELPADWQQRFRSLIALWHPSAIRDRVSHDHAFLYRSQAAALIAWEEAVDDGAAALDSSGTPCRRFWQVLQTVLASASLRPSDHRRDVVHVFDAYEARQWRLPVVFLCGMVEKHFPKYHAENSILGDTLRRRMQAAGIPLRTSVERQSDEQLLFEIALSRATEAVVLSYPVLNAKADANLASFLLERAKPFETADSIDVRPAPRHARASEPCPGIFDDRLREQLATRHATIAASAIESYLQCAYQFFAQRSLRLADPPADPWDRLDVIVQGNIAHAVLERVYREKRRVSDVFDAVFAEHCAKNRIPSGYRTEAVRLDLKYNLQLLVRDTRIPAAARSLYEHNFQLPLGDGTLVTGRIDRIEIDTAGNATVIDYKYSGKLSIARAKNGHDEQTRVQGGLYLLALRRLDEFTPAGMVYCGFKREVSFGGWIIRPYYMEIKEDCTEDRLHEVMRLSREAALRAVESIRSGKITPKPADETRCQFCDYARICRVENVAAAAVMGAPVLS